MLFLLVSRVTLDSLLPVPGIVLRLEAVIEPEPTWKPMLVPNWTNKQPLAGAVSATGFHFVRRIGYQNPLRPLVSGRFIPNGTGTRVQVLVWSPAALIVTTTLVVAAFGAAIANQWEAAAAIALFAALIHGLACLGFSIDKAESLTTLRKALSAVSED